jgi:hypothetical protein
MDHIDEVLTTNALDTYIPISIEAALAMGKKTLNRYYSKTDLSEVYRTAMSKSFFLLLLSVIDIVIWSVLHPRHKLQYFTNAGWSDEWITTARSMVRDAFERSYKCFPGDKPTTLAVDTVRRQRIFGTGLD